MQSNEQCWTDARNWMGGVYRCADDSRLWVPKRLGGGITVNMAHRYGWPSALLLLLSVFAPIGGVFLLASRPAGLLATFGGGLAAAGAVYALARLARADDHAAV